MTDALERLMWAVVFRWRWLLLIGLAVEVHAGVLRAMDLVNMGGLYWAIPILTKWGAEKHDK